MTDIHDAALFLAHACALEEDAANRFSDLSEAMKTYGNQEVAAFFGQMAKFSRLHLAEARERSGFRKIPIWRRKTSSGPTATARKRPRWKARTI